MSGPCKRCVFLGDDGLCFAEEPKDCPRGLLTVDFFDDDLDLEEDLEELEARDEG
jgi:hypothetical protein